MFTSRRPLHISVAVLAMMLAACVPSHPIKPLPDFVQLAIEPGDRVEVTTHTGDVYEFEVVAVTAEAIHSKRGRVFPLSEIAGLKEIAWEKPPSPCGGEKELGCSVPFLVSVISEEHGHYREAFYTACEQHDYCYRHGARTYGLDRDDCDAEFLDNMLDICPAESTSVFGSIVDMMSDDVNSRSVCLQVADDFHRAARTYGEKHFQANTDSTYCEYNGPL